MGRFVEGYKEISVNLIDFKGDDLARAACKFGALGEFYEGADKLPYDPNHPHFQKVVDEIINGRTFPKYCFEGSNIAFQINNISRICLAQLTREKGFFCSQSGDTRPLTQEFVTPKAIYARKDWMERLEKIERQIEDLYCDMCEDGITYMESRYFGFHAQTISLTYNATVMQWLNSCNSRTENNFADEINYVYRLMRNELVKAIETQVTDPLSKKLWKWLLTFSDRKTFYKRDNTYNNDFARYPTPEGYDFGNKAHNDWRKSSWKLELEDMYKNQPELLLPGEKEMIEKWMAAEANGEELPADYDPNDWSTAVTRIKQMPYYRSKEERM